MLFYITLVVLCAHATCDLIDVFIEDDNVHYKLTDQTCALSEIKDKYIGKRVGELLLANSRFTFDTDLSMGETFDGMYNFFLVVENSTVVVDYPTRINMIEYATGEMMLNRDMYALEIIFSNSPQVMLSTIKTSSGSTLRCCRLQVC